MRLPYFKLAPEVVGAMGAASRLLYAGAIPAKLRILVELRVSLINGCAYCIDMHSHDAREVGETQQRLDCITVWRECEFYTEQEKAAFQWAEEVTRLAPDHTSDEAFERVKKAFSEKEVVELTAIIAMVNAWNRLAISMRREPAART